jgi:hypothetical protein
VQYPELAWLHSHAASKLLHRACREYPGMLMKVPRASAFLWPVSSPRAAASPKQHTMDSRIDMWHVHFHTATHVPHTCQGRELSPAVHRQLDARIEFTHAVALPALARFQGTLSAHPPGQQQSKTQDNSQRVHARRPRHSHHSQGHASPDGK